MGVRLAEGTLAGRCFQIVARCQWRLELLKDLGLLLIAVVTVSILVSDILATGRPAGAIPFQAGKPPVIMLGLQTGNATIIKNTSGISTVREKINIVLTHTHIGIRLAV